MRRSSLRMPKQRWVPRTSTRWWRAPAARSQLRCRRLFCPFAWNVVQIAPFQSCSQLVLDIKYLTSNSYNIFSDSWKLKHASNCDSELFLTVINEKVNSPSQYFFLHSYVRLMFDLPLCSARLFEEGLSIHTYETILPRTKFNHYAELITSLGPRSRRVRVFQTCRILLLF